MASRDLCRLVLVLSMIGWVGRVPAAELPASIGSFFAAHCLSCHDAEMKKGGLDLAPSRPRSMTQSRPPGGSGCTTG